MPRTFTITIEDALPPLPGVVRDLPGLLVGTARDLLGRCARQLSAASRMPVPAGQNDPGTPATARARLAVLIDADNAQATRIGPVLGEIATLGSATLTRAYGDWASTGLRPWKERLGAHAIDAVQVFAPVKGKNATDSALMIDAMDLLHAGQHDGFCLVSSDSDFTRLATRLRQAGKLVHGFGRATTPPTFVAACTTFRYVEDLDTPTSPPARPTTPTPRKAVPRPVTAKATAASAVPTQRTPLLRSDTKLVTRLRAAVEATRDPDGWSNKAQVCALLRSQTPPLRPQDYGHRKLSDLIDAVDLFEHERRPTPSGKTTTIYLRDKRRRRTEK